MKQAVNKEKVDVLIIGAGPIGMACGIEAKKRTLSYLILDKGTLVNSLYHYPLGMTFFSTSEKLEIGEVPFISHNPKPTRSEALEYYRRVAMSWDLNVGLYEKVEKVTTNKEGHTVKTSKRTITAENVILATGFYDIPHMLGIPGEDLPKVHHYYKEPHPYYGQRIVIIGAANSAVDAALETYRKGAEVTMVIREDKIKDTVKYWVKPDIENRIKEGSIQAHFNSSVTEITPHTVKIKTPEKELEIQNDFVLAMTGYEPNYTFLKNMGIRIRNEAPFVPDYDPSTMETNVSGIYLAGVICGGMETNKWFIENSRVHAEMILEDITQKRAITSALPK